MWPIVITNENSLRDTTLMVNALVYMHKVVGAIHGARLHTQHIFLNLVANNTLFVGYLYHL